MLTNRRILSATVIAAAMALTACGGDTSDTGARTSYERADDRAMGSESAPITLIEYASVACTHCADFHENVYPSIHEEFIETGQVRFVFREMITGSAPLAVAGFMLARCAPEDRYFDMIDLLFQQQQAIFTSAQRPGAALEEYRSIARSVGISDTRFTECINSEDLRQDVLDAHQQAIDDGIESTPQFLINGELLDTRRGDGVVIYTLGGEPVMIDGETVPALQNEETFRRLLNHVVAEAGGTPSPEMPTDGTMDSDMPEAPSNDPMEPESTPVETSDSGDEG
tara:strand:+ start:2890 stop:3738 length:849 start_codon:yes stop_codon:yes gene_type:complete